MSGLFCHLYLMYGFVVSPRGVGVRKNSIHKQTTSKDW